MKNFAFKFISITALIGVASLASSAVNAEESENKMYITGAVGRNFPMERHNKGAEFDYDERTDPGMSGEVGIGYDFGALRIEATYSLDYSKLDDYYKSSTKTTYKYLSGGDSKKQSIFLSGYWDIFRNSRWTPYVGGGIGYSTLNVERVSDYSATYNSYDPTVFAYQLKAGVSCAATSDVTIFLEGVFRSTDRFDTNDGYYEWDNESWRSFGGQLGVRISL